MQIRQSKIHGATEKHMFALQLKGSETQVEHFRDRSCIHYSIRNSACKQ